MAVMLDITALIAPETDRDVPRRVPGEADGPAPAVVWNATRRCNLACRHCYSDSTGRVVPELSTDEAADMVADLAAFGCPTLVVSGGEPLLRPDVLDLIAEARRLGLDVVLSTNGTQVTVPVAQRLARLGLRRVVVGLDGIGVVHDAFRGRRAAFAHALRGIRLLRRAGVPVGVETTIAHSILPSLSGILALVEAEGAESVCFRHLVPAGRGWTRPAIAPLTVRTALDELFTWAEQAVGRGVAIRVLTAGNYADGAALVLWLGRRDPARAARAERLLDAEGGAASGAGHHMAAIDWEGWIRPDPSWGGPALGSIRERPFSAVWSDPPQALIDLRHRGDDLCARCARCRFLAMCGGGLAARALAAGDLRGPDPACHLGREEIGSAA